jgi:hypothetical protein
VVIIGQILEYPPVLFSILLSIKNNLVPDQHSKRLIDEQEERLLVGEESIKVRSEEDNSGDSDSQSSQIDSNNDKIQKTTFVSDKY